MSYAYLYYIFDCCSVHTLTQNTHNWLLAGCFFFHTDVLMVSEYVLFVVGKEVKLSLPAEEVALFFAQMLDHEYTTKEVFRNNFFRDWRKVNHSFTCKPSSMFNQYYLTSVLQWGGMGVRLWVWNSYEACSIPEGLRAYHAELISCCLVLNALENTICVKALIC